MPNFSNPKNLNDDFSGPFCEQNTVSSETPSSIDDAENEWPTKLVTDAAHVSRVRFAV